MPYMLKKITLFLLIGMIIGCGSSKKTTIVTKKEPVGWKYSKPIQNSGSSNATTSSSSKSLNISEITKAYIAQYSGVAMNNMKIYGIPASIILAQGILESGSG